MFPLTLTYQLEILPPNGTPISVQNPKQQLKLKYKLLLDATPPLPFLVEFDSYKTILIHPPVKFNVHTRTFTFNCGFQVLEKEAADKFIQEKLADGWVVD